MGQVASSISAGMKATMEENMKKQMDFQKDIMQVTMERQIAMQNEIRERQMSMQIARAREIFKYYGTFVGVLAVVCPLAAYKNKSPTPLIPLLPLSFVLTFQYDAAYGTLMSRARAEAENIITMERNFLQLPSGLPTFEIIENKRLERKNQ